MRDDTDRPRDGKDPSTFRVLRLIHPSPPTAPKKRGRKRVFHLDLFSEEEARRLRAALRSARRVFGSTAALAAVLGAAPDTVTAAASGKTPFSGALAIRLARALGVPLESLYAAPRTASKCAACGARRAP